MDWTEITEALIAEAFNGKELEAVTMRRNAETADPVPGIIAGLAGRIRACVSAPGKVRLQGGSLSIPQALRNEATAILRLKLLTRYALSVTEERKREATDAEARLDAIAKGEIPLVDAIVTNEPTYHGRPKRWQSPMLGGVM